MNIIFHDVLLLCIGCVYTKIETVLIICNLHSVY